jgi:hypothetical protein
MRKSISNTAANIVHHQHHHNAHGNTPTQQQQDGNNAGGGGGAGSGSGEEIIARRADAHFEEIEKCWTYVEKQQQKKDKGKEVVMVSRKKN